jgi:hypothetical protein
MADKSTFFQWLIPTKGLAPYYDAFLNLINAIDQSLWTVKNTAGVATKLNMWTDATRPTNPDPGDVGFNSDHSQIELWDGNAWRLI